MKRLIALLIGAIVIGAAAFLLTTFPLNREPVYPGYMEADLVLVGSEQEGRIATLAVQEGDSVKQGDPVFTLESSEQEASVNAAKARVAEAEARLADAKAAAAAAARDRSPASGTGARSSHAEAIDDKPRPRADAVRQRLGRQSPARRCRGAARQQRGCGGRGGAAHHCGKASRPLGHDRCCCCGGRGGSPFVGRGREESRQAQGVCAGRRHHRGSLFSSRRSGEGGPGGGVAAAAFQSQGSVLRRRAGTRQAQGRPDRQCLLRRLPGGPPRQDQLHRARCRVHAAGDFLARAAREARLSRRGAPHRATAELTAGQPVSVALGPQPQAAQR